MLGSVWGCSREYATATKLRLAEAEARESAHRTVCPRASKRLAFAIIIRCLLHRQGGCRQVMFLDEIDSSWVRQRGGHYRCYEERAKNERMPLLCGQIHPGNYSVIDVRRRSRPTESEAMYLNLEVQSSSADKLAYQ